MSGTYGSHPDRDALTTFGFCGTCNDERVLVVTGPVDTSGYTCVMCGSSDVSMYSPKETPQDDIPTGPDTEHIPRLPRRRER